MKQLCLVLLSLVNFWMLSAQTYSVGDVYTAPDGSQGIVYYLFPDGTGGWVVALNDASSGCTWGENVDVPQLENFSTYYYTFYHGDTASYTNTQILRTYQNNSSYASGTVDFAHGWTLPTLRQLRALCSQMAFVSAPLLAEGGTAMAMSYYWTSVEYSSEKAWAVDFGGGYGGMYSSNKTESYRVRAVRSFSYLSSSATSNYSYSWSTGENTQEITVTPMETTTYTVTVTEVGGNVVGTASTTIDVSCNVPEVSVVATDETICAGEEVTIEATVLNANDFIAPPTPPAVAVGDILCTDGTTVKSSAYAASGKTAMGIVLYVNTNGHGWAINLHEQGPMAWSTAQSGSIPNAIVQDSPAEAIFDYNGSYNTWAIRSVTNTSLYPAAMAVDYDNGWYLPASGQLYLMYPLMPILNESLAICGGTLFDLNSSWYYCSSTVALARNMWSLDRYGFVIHYLPGISYNIRSMRDF